MFNVLPHNLKIAIKKEYLLRRWIVILEAMLFLAVSFIILLFPTWLLTFYNNIAVGLDVSAQQKFTSSRNTHDVFNIIDATNEKLNIINQNFKYSQIVPLINTVISAKNSSISIRNLSIVTSGPSTATISLDGVSGTREALVTFVKRLQSVPTFSNVISPVSNLAKDSNIEFNLTLTSTQ